jgi:hypothetical protein
MTTVGLAVVVLFPKAETTFEFDAVNLRDRVCKRQRSWLLDFVFYDRFDPPRDHPTAVRLRELGVLPAVREQEARWVLIKGFTSGVKGWKGNGRHYLDALGATTFGTPVPGWADENLSANPWVRWAVKDKVEATAFWPEFQTYAVKRPDFGGLYLMGARDCLANNDFRVSAPEVNERARLSIDP